MLNFELRELIDRPNETLEAEYKSWLDLSDNVVRAKVACHIAALSNHGGGHIVFGFEDSMSPSDPTLAPAKPYTRDDISGICKKYLVPAPQCDVLELTSASGTVHTIIVVPPHGSVPVCAKANGPLVDKKIVGISQGTYYTRKTGPESAPVIDPAEWSPIIRRCAMHDRSAILGALNAALQVKMPTISSSEDLKRWHDSAMVIFRRDASAHQWDGLDFGQIQYSYCIARADGQILDVSNLLEIIRTINLEVHERVRTGWTMFYPFTKTEIEPRFETDASATDETVEFLESRPMRNAHPSFVDMWRVAPTGMATLIRPYWEDDTSGNAHYKRKRGSWLSPDYQFRALAEIVRHAQGMAARFAEPVSVAFRCEWTGLGSRELFDPRYNWNPGRVASSSSRLTKDEWPVAALESDWPDIVARLGAPLIRVFVTDLSLDAQWVRSRAESWRKM